MSNLWTLPTFNGYLIWLSTAELISTSRVILHQLGCLEAAAAEPIGAAERCTLNRSHLNSCTAAHRLCEVHVEPGCVLQQLLRRQNAQNTSNIWAVAIMNACDICSCGTSLLLCTESTRLQALTSCILYGVSP